MFNFFLFFQEYLVPLFLNKFGSGVIGSICDWGSISKQKPIIASTLCDRIAQLNGNQFGKFISEKMALHIYKREGQETEGS